MPSSSDWTVPTDLQPQAGDHDYDLDAALAAVVGLKAMIPGDAFTAFSGRRLSATAAVM